jgi:hypothetical protein
MLKETADGHLEGMEHVTLISMVGFGLAAWMMFKIEKVVEKRSPMPPIEADII